MYHGIINVYKEPGYTSHDVVARLRGILRQKKIGHTGTLDPEAEGVLVVCLGNGTKLCELLENHTKSYEADLLLGVATDTQDMTGNIVSEDREGALALDEGAVREAILTFKGTYAQVPPMYSALKVEGKKLCDLARAGKTVERRARQVTIHGIFVESLDLPRVRLRVDCSKGTYIRTLCDDIGRILGCGGTMGHLKRLRVGSLCIGDSITLDEIERLKGEGCLSARIIGVEEILSEYPEIRVLPQGDRALHNGNPCFYAQLALDDTSGQRAGTERDGALFRMYDSTGAFCGLYVYQERRRWWKPWKMFWTDKE